MEKVPAVGQVIDIIEYCRAKERFFERQWLDSLATAKAFRERDMLLFAHQMQAKAVEARKCLNHWRDMVRKYCVGKYMRQAHQRQEAIDTLFPAESHRYTLKSISVELPTSYAKPVDEST